MALHKSEAILLKAFNWSESSRTVVFFTRRVGKLPLVDRGGRSIKSRRGRLHPFSPLELTYYSSEKESRGYLSSIDLIEARRFEGEGSLGRLAFGSAACELLYLLLPEEEAQVGLYDYFNAYLKYVDLADRRSLPALFLAFFLRTLSSLGYHPSLDRCVGCNRETGDSAPESDDVLFSPERGGAICAACQTAGDYYIRLSSRAAGRLATLQKSGLSQAAAVPISYQEASLLLEALGKFVRYQADLKGDLKSLEFLQKLKNTNLS